MPVRKNKTVSVVKKPAKCKGWQTFGRVLIVLWNALLDAVWFVVELFKVVALGAAALLVGLGVFFAGLSYLSTNVSELQNLLNSSIRLRNLEVAPQMMRDEMRLMQDVQSTRDALLSTQE